MAWELQGECESCGARFGPLVDRGVSIYLCRGCSEFHSIDQAPRQFAMPRCKRCDRRYLKSDAVRERDACVCPSCGNCSLGWSTRAHLRVHYEEPAPEIGDIVQGYIRNTGTIQRIEFVNSVLLGRMAMDEPELEDGTPVEAEIAGLGERSFDVRDIRVLADIPPKKRREPGRS